MEWHSVCDQTGDLGLFSARAFSQPDGVIADGSFMLVSSRHWRPGVEGGGRRALTMHLARARLVCSAILATDEASPLWSGGAPTRVAQAALSIFREAAAARLECLTTVPGRPRTFLVGANLQPPSHII